MRQEKSAVDASMLLSEKMKSPSRSLWTACTITVLADGSKLGATSRVAGDSAAPLDFLRTDDGAPKAAIAELRERFTKIL